MTIKLGKEKYLSIGYGSEWTRREIRGYKTPLGWDLHIGKVFITYDNFNRIGRRGLN
jgi:hypothetical protein